MAQDDADSQRGRLIHHGLCVDQRDGQLLGELFEGTDLTAVPGHTGSPTQQYLHHVGKVHAVAVVGDLEQFGTVCGAALARPSDRLFLDVPA